MLLKHQYLKFAYVDIALVVSKMCRGNLTAGILAIGVTVVLSSEIDTNCLNLIYFKHVLIQKKICKYKYKYKTLFRKHSQATRR